MAKYFYDKPGAFLATVRKLINENERPYVLLAGDLKVPAIWLKKVADGDIENPGLNRIEYVYEQLTGKKLPTK